MTTDFRPPRSTDHKISALAVAIGGILFVSYFVSLCLPAIYFSRNLANPAGDYYPGWALLLLGWLETLGLSVRGMTWMANPFFAVGLITFSLGLYAPSAALQLLAVGFASLTFVVKTVMTDEAGHEHPIVGYGPGFWVWYATIIAAFAISSAFAISQVSAIKSKGVDETAELLGKSSR